MDRPKRILIFSLSYLPMIGGAEVAIKEITDRIKETDFDFSMITLRYDSALPKFEKIGRVSVYRIGLVRKHPTPEVLSGWFMRMNKILYPAFALWRAYRLDRKNRFDAFWSMMSYMGFPAILFGLFFRRMPYVLTLQEGDNLEEAVSWKKIGPFKPLLKKVFRDASVVWAISNYLADWARLMGYIGKVEIIPNGVDIERFQNAAAKQEGGLLRQKLGFAEGDKVVVTASRLVVKNGVDVLIKTAQFLPTEFKFLIVGDGPLKESLEKLSDDLGLTDRVIFTGFAPQEKIPDYLHSADIFCRPSRSEGQGIAYLEAMAAGSPVVATKVGGIPDFIEDGKTGVFASLDDPHDLAEKILKVANNSKLSKNISAKAKALVEKDYDWSNVVPRADEVFKKVSYSRFEGPR